MFILRIYSLYSIIKLFGSNSEYVDIKQWGFCDIQNNQGWSKGYQPKLKAEAEIPYQDLDYCGYHKKRIYR